MNLRFNRLWGVAGGMVVVAVLSAEVSHAQAMGGERLPPPPTVSVPDLQPLATPSNLPPMQEETVFQSPLLAPPSNPTRYLVIVNSSSAYLLQQVRNVEPSASLQTFEGQRVIQAGSFADEASARQQVAVLSQQGIRAEVVSNDLSAPNLSRTSPYLVVIPGNRGNLAGLADQAVQLGVRQSAIQQKEAPKGPHLEIGPFEDYGEAQEVSRYLRRGGLDARVFFNQ